MPNGVIQSPVDRDLRRNMLLNFRVENRTTSPNAAGSVEGLLYYDSNSAVRKLTYCVDGSVPTYVTVPRPDSTETVSGLWTFSRSGAPFAVSNSTVVTNLNADKVDGFNASVAVNNSTVAVRDTDGTLKASDPVDSDDLVTKGFAEQMFRDRDVKDPVVAASTGNVNLSSPGASIDGVTLGSNARVLLKDQSTGSENGVWIFNGASSAMTRAADVNADSEVSAGLQVFVLGGTTHGGGEFTLQTADPITVGSTSLSFVQTGGQSIYSAGNGLVKSGNTFNFAQSGSYTAGALPYANGTSTIGFIGAAATGNVLKSAGTGQSPVYGKVDVTSDITGVIPIANGGTGSSTQQPSGRILITGGNGVHTTDAELTYDSSANKITSGSAQLNHIGLGVAPDTTYRLKTTGKSRLYNTTDFALLAETTGSNTAIFNATSTPPNYIVDFRLAGNSKVRIEPDGDLHAVEKISVGLGSPVYDVHVQRMNARIAVDNGTVENLLQADSTIGYVGTNTNHKLILKTNNTSRLEIESDGTVKVVGKLGVGVTPSLFNFHVAAGNKLLAGGYTLLERTTTDENNNTLYVQSTGLANNQALARFSYGATAGGANTGTETFVIAKTASYFNSRLGIGVSPDTALSIQGSTNLNAKIKLTNTNPSTDNVWSIHANYNDQSLRFIGDSNLVLGMYDDGWLKVGASQKDFARQSNFGYTSGSYKVLQLGTCGSQSGIAIGVDVSTNASGSFSGNEIIFPNQKTILTPNSGDDSYLGIWATDSANKLRIGNYRYNILNDTPGITIDLSSASNSGQVTLGNLPTSTADNSLIVESSGLLKKRTANSGIWTTNLGANRLLVSNSSGVITSDSRFVHLGGRVSLTGAIDSSANLKVDIVEHDVSSNDTNHEKAIYAYASGGYNIASGVTDSGYRIAVDASSFVNDSDFQGTLNQQYSVWARHGAYTSGSGSTISNSYGVFIESLTNSNTTISNLWGLYQSDGAAKNFFAGNVGIGTTGSYTISEPLTIANSTNAGIGLKSTTTQNSANVKFYNQQSLKWTIEKYGSGHTLAIKDAGNIAAITCAQGGSVSLGNLSTSTTDTNVIVESSGLLKKRATDSCAFDGAAKEIRFTGVHGSATIDLDTAADGLYSNYGSNSYWSNTPTTMYGAVWSQTSGSFGFQLAFNIRHGNTDYGDLYLRTKNNSGLSNWRKIYHTGNLTLSSLSGVGGSGTVGKIPLWSGNTTTLGDSILSQSSSTVYVAGSLSANSTIASTHNGSNRAILSYGGGGNGVANLYASDNSLKVHFSSYDDNYILGQNLGIGTDDPDCKMHIGPSALVSTYTPTTTTLAVSDTTNGAELVLRGKSPRLWFDSTAGGKGEIYLDGAQLNILSGNPQTNQIGSSRLYINASGEIGIGTDDPAALIHGMSGDLFLTANSTSADSGQGIYFQSTTSGWATNSAHAAIFGKRVDGSNGYLRFDTRSGGNTAERMRIDSAGNVGIGASSNLSAKLQVLKSDSGEAFRIDGASGGFAVIVSGGSSYKTSLRSASIGGNYTTETPPTNGLIVEGNVGINQVSPQAKLHITGSGSAGSVDNVLVLQSDVSDAPAIQFSETTGAGFNNGMNIAYRGDFGGGSDNAIVIAGISASSSSVGHAVATFKNGGNCGIGTADPDNKLTIADSATVAVGKQWGLDFQDTGKGEPQAYVYAEGRYSTNYNTDLVFGTIGTSGSATERMRIDSSGNVGIGTDDPAHVFTVHKSSGAVNTPIAWIHNSGNFANYDGTVISCVNNGSDAEVLHVRTNNTTYNGGTSLMLVRGDGNVGIGTDDPSNQLTLYRATGDHFPISLQANNIGTAGTYLGIQFGYTGGTYQKGALIYESQDGHGRGKMHFALDNNANSNNADITDAVMTLTHGGQLLIKDGLVGAPSLSFINDPNTGMFRAGSDHLQLVSGGTGRLKVTADVSIIGATDLLVTGANRRLSFTSGTGTVRTTTAADLYLATNNTTRLTITAGGYVVPSYLKLDSKTLLSSGSMVTGLFEFSNETNARLYFTRSTGNRARIAQVYETTIGNGSATSFTINHNLGGAPAAVTMRDTSSGEYFEVDWSYTNANNITVSLQEVATSNEYTVTIVA